MASISVIIPTYHRPESLQTCLESLFASGSDLIREVILVVHEEDDQTQRVAARWAESRHLIRLAYTRNASRSAARNAGAAVASGAWCYFLDDDVFLCPSSLQELRASVEKYPQAAAVGGPNLAPPGSMPFARCVNRVLSSRLGAWTMNARYAGLEEDTWVDERSLIACNLAVRTDLLRGPEPFDKRLDYGEETLLLARLSRAGHKLLHAPRMRVYHRRRSTWLGFCAQAFHSGLGRARMTAVLPASLSWEFLGPPLLVLAAPLLPWLGSWFLLPLAAYALLCAREGVSAARSEGRLGAAFWVAGLIPSGHLAYGLGIWSGAGAWLPATARQMAGRILPPSAAELALRLADTPFLGGALRAYYRAAVAAVRLWALGAGLDLREIWLYRGMAGREWTPGGSDVDLIAEIPCVGIDEERNIFARWCQGYGRLRRVFPMLGEVQIATGPEIRRYVQDGPIRARELPEQARPLLRNGALQRPGPAADGAPAQWLATKQSVSAWTEMLHAYTRLSHLFFDGMADRRRSAYTARKLLLDIFRYGRLIRAAGADARAEPQVMSRSQLAAACAKDGRLGEVLGRLERLGGARETLDHAGAVVLAGAGEMEACARIVMDGVPSGAATPCAEVRAAQEPRERESFERFCKWLQSALGSGLRRAIHDNVFYFLLGVSREAMEPGSARFWQELRRAKHGAMPLEGALLALGDAALKLALWSPFSEDPLKSLSLAAAHDGGEICAAISGRSPLLRRHCLATWRVGHELLSPPPLTLAKLLAQESSAHLLMNWRSLLGPACRESALQRWVYLCSRAMSLRLLLDRAEAHPTFPLEPLALRFAEIHPAESAWVRRHVLDGAAMECSSAHWEFFARQMRALAACNNSN